MKDLLNARTINLEMYDRVGRMGSSEVPRDPILKVSNAHRVACSTSFKMRGTHAAFWPSWGGIGLRIFYKKLEDLL